MRDISARELKGHNILAVERFRDNTRWMIEFSVLRTCSYGSPGDEMRLFLTEDGYQAALLSQKRRGNQNQAVCPCCGRAYHRLQAEKESPPVNHPLPRKD